jgi:hypothetical protein
MQEQTRLAGLRLCPLFPENIARALSRTISALAVLLPNVLQPLFTHGHRDIGSGLTILSHGTRP